MYIPNDVGDIDCNYRDPLTGEHKWFCKICGGLAMVLTKCNARKDCVAFDMEAPANGSKTGCGYLKSARGPVAPLPGHGLHIRDQIGAGSFRLVPETETIKNEISCGYVDSMGPRGFCKVCGGVNAVIARCNTFAEKCLAFNMEDDDCGYLKSAAIFTERPGFMSYEKL